MLINHILFFSTSDNDKSTSEKSHGCKKEEKDCMCHNCFGEYVCKWAQESPGQKRDLSSIHEKRADRKRKREQEREEQRKRQKQSDGCSMGYPSRGSPGMSSGATSTADMTDGPENNQENQRNDKKEDDKSKTDD